MRNAFLAAVLILGLAGCASAPEKPAAVASKAEEKAAQPVVYERVSVSDPSRENISAPFRAERGRVFPDNKSNSSLAFSAGVAMPRLSVVDLGGGQVQVYVRILNRSTQDQVLTFRCVTGEGEKAERYTRSGVLFPQGMYRDYSFRMADVPGQRLYLTVKP